MGDSVLGRDPFTRPAADVPSPPGQEVSSAPAQSKPAPRPAKPVARHRPKRPRVAKPARSEDVIALAADEALRLVSPRADPEEAEPPPFPKAEEIDRLELIDAENGADAEEPLDSMLQTLFRRLAPEALIRRLSERVLRCGSGEVDAFGFDPAVWEQARPVLKILFETYWRVTVRGAENLPERGRVLLVANHSGALPYDGLMIKLAAAARRPDPSDVRVLLEDFVFHFPFLGTFMNRAGGVRANPDNARRLLEAEHGVVVFPEGTKGLGKLFRERYRLQRFGRGGFVKLALRTGAPVIPVAVVGGEEIHPILARLFWLARPLGLPYLPVTPTFPALGPLGVLPLPSKWCIEFGTPIPLPSPKAADPDDPLAITPLAEEIREAIQQMVNNLIESRGHPFFG